MTDKQFLIDCINKGYDKCNNTSCKSCEYFDLGRETCEVNLLADYLMQNGFFRQCDRSDAE